MQRDCQLLRILRVQREGQMFTVLCVQRKVQVLTALRVQREVDVQSAALLICRELQPHAPGYHCECMCGAPWCII